MQHYHRLASDVNLEDEVELQRLEGGAPAATLTTGMQVDAVQWRVVHAGAGGNKHHRLRRGNG
eukprot:3709090-Prymnesium_polylepis.1